jgi:hypothetical protein
VLTFSFETHHVFIDFRAAHDSIDVSKPYVVVEDLRVPKKLIALVKVTMRNACCKIRIQKVFSDPVPIKMVFGKEML